jgi:hypothetical protein
MCAQAVGDVVDGGRRDPATTPLTCGFSVPPGVEESFREGFRSLFRHLGSPGCHVDKSVARAAYPQPSRVFNRPRTDTSE